MKKLSEYKDGEALDLIADVMEPVVSMTSNKEFMKVMNDDAVPRLVKVQTAIRTCKNEIINILAILNHVPVDEYHCSVASIIADTADLLSDEDFLGFFGTQGQKTLGTVSGSATENTVENEA